MDAPEYKQITEEFLQARVNSNILTGESDDYHGGVLIKKNIDEFFNEQYSVYGYCQKAQPHNPFNIGRMLPMLCWMNVRCTSM